MWLERCLGMLGAGPAAVVAPPEAGAYSLIAALEQPDEPLLWVGFTPEDEGDPFGQGRKLEAAIDRKLGRGLLPKGLTAEAGLETLNASLHYLGPLLLAFSGAHHTPELIERLLKMHRSGCRVLLHFEVQPGDLTLPDHVQLITANMLRLTHAEALELAEERLTEPEVRHLHDASGGLAERFMRLLHQKLVLTPYLTPSPDGPRPPSNGASSLRPTALLDLLVKKDRWLDALEVAVHNLPELVPGVLEVAGHHFHAEGLHKRLYILLESLPNDLQQHETVRFWRLQAAFRLGRCEAQLKEVEAYLEHREAPELRALYAGVFAIPHEMALQQAERAYRAKPTPFTAFQLGRLSYGPAALGVLKNSVVLAEQQGFPYEAARNAGALAAKLVWQGAYQEAAGWGQWALREFDRHNINDPQRRLRTVNDWAYARLMTGGLAGLEALLREHEIHLAESHPDLARLFRDTLGDFLTAQGRPVEALHYYRLNFEAATREELPVAALKMVRVQLELGRNEDALATARQALEVTKNVSAEMQAPAQLAYGMVLALNEPVAARAHLQRACAVFAEFRCAYRLAQAELYLAYTHVALGDADVREVLADSFEIIGTLPPSALRLLSGPEEAFRPVWGLWLGEGSPLELRLMGRKEVWWQGKQIELYPQWLEILTVLAIRGRPLTLEALLAELYGDGGSKSTLKASLSRLRQLLPISSHPYGLTVEVRADFLDVATSLKRGDLNEAIRRYRGPLLLASEAACVREYDEMLAESLRRAALAKQDPEGLLRLSDVFPEDLELLEAASTLLGAGDPRVPMVLARLEQLRRLW